MSAYAAYVPGQLVGRDSLQHQLPGIGILTLIPLQRGVDQMDAQQRRRQNDQEYGNPAQV